jgi:type II secretory pathway pseudopilin PulG
MSPYPSPLDDTQMNNKTIRQSQVKQKKNNKAVSHVISTIIISASLLIILASAAFVATNILNIQVANTEFEQAKANMLLLDEVIQSAALRRGSGGYTQFNQRSGGINIIQTDQTLKIIGSDSQELYAAPNLVTLVYAGGSQVAGSDTPLRGGNSLSVNLTGALSYVRVETGNGTQISLDYNRVRIIPTGIIMVGVESYNIIEITLIRLIQGETRGSGIVYVRAQNINTITNTITYEGGVVTIEVQLYTSPDNPYPIKTSLEFNSTANKTAVLLTEIQVQISIS